MFFNLAKCTFHPCLAPADLHACRSTPLNIVQAGNVTVPVSEAARWLILPTDTAAASNTTATAQATNLDVAVNPKQSVELSAFFASVVDTDLPSALLPREMRVYLTFAPPDSAAAPITALQSSSLFCNEDWLVVAHKDQPYFSVTRKRSVLTVPRLTLVVGSYLATGVVATLAQIRCEDTLCLETDELSPCTPCCGFLDPDPVADVPPATALQALSWRPLPHGCDPQTLPCGEIVPECRGVKPLPLVNRTRVGRLVPCASCPCPRPRPRSRRCCTVDVPVDPCVPQPLLTRTDYFCTPTMGDACTNAYFFPVTQGPAGSPVVVSSTGGYTSTVSFEFATDPDVQGVVTALTPVTMFVSGIQVGWHRTQTIAGASGDITLRMLTLVWGPSTVNSVLVSTIVSGTSCEGDPYVNCNGVTTILPNTILVCSADDLDPETPSAQMMFLVLTEVPLLNLPAGAIVFTCYNDLALSGFNMDAFVPIVWQIRDNGSVSFSAYVEETC